MFVLVIVSINSAKWLVLVNILFLDIQCLDQSVISF